MNYITAGLLHDIGLVVMQNNFADKYFNAIKNCSIQGQALYEAESEMFAVTHQEIGGYLLEWWGLPFPIVESSLYHHNPLASSTANRELVCALHLADYYAWSYLGRKDLVKLDDRVFDSMGLSQERCENLFNEALDSWKAELGFNN